MYKIFAVSIFATFLASCSSGGNEYVDNSVAVKVCKAGNIIFKYVGTKDKGGTGRLWTSTRSVGWNQMFWIPSDITIDKVCE